MKLIVNSMELKDLESVARLSDQLGYPVQKETLLERFQEISQLPLNALFVIRAEDEVLGWIHLEITSALVEPKRVEIKALVVDETYRGQGLGRKLIHKSKVWAQSKGLDTIYLSSNIKRDRTHDFYLKEGFIKNKTSHFFELKI